MGVLNLPRLFSLCEAQLPAIELSDFPLNSANPYSPYLSESSKFRTKKCQKVSIIPFNRIFFLFLAHLNFA